MRWAVLVVPLLLAGCAAPEGLGLSGGGDTPREPFYAEHREKVEGEHARTFEVPVDAGATLANVTIVLDARTNGLPLPETSPAQLEVALLAPDGTAIGAAVLDAQQPRVSLLETTPAAGLYLLEVRGVGAAPELDGRSYGAGYVVTIEVLYAE